MRKVTQTTLVANAVTNLTGRGFMKFNDKLKDGTRSLKVWGWDNKDYDSAALLLKLLGCEVKVVKFAGYSFRAGHSYTQTRLHVKEKV